MINHFILMTDNRSLLLFVALILLLCVNSFSATQPDEAFPGHTEISIEFTDSSEALSLLSKTEEPTSAANALLFLTSNPERTARNTSLIISELPNMQGKLNICLLPFGVNEYQSDWNRKEAVLAWLAESLRNSYPSIARTEARKLLLDYCSSIVRENITHIDKAHAYICGYNSIFYGDNFYVVPSSNTEDFLKLLEACVDPVVVNYDSNGLSEGSVKEYFSKETEIEKAIRSTLDGFINSTPELWGEYEKILKASRLIRNPIDAAKMSTSWHFLGMPISEDFLQHLRQSEQIQVGDDFAPPFSSYAFAFGYILVETRYKQAENARIIFDLSDKGLFPLDWFIHPVYEDALPYEKALVDKQIEFLKTRALDKSSWKPVGFYFSKPVRNSIDSIFWLNKLIDIERLGEARTDLYAKEKITYVLIDILRSENEVSVRIQASEALLHIVRQDISLAPIVLAGVETVLSDLENQQDDSSQGSDSKEQLLSNILAIIETAKKTLN